MKFRLDDTIAALASPPGSAARGIVRLSGARTRAVLGGLFDPAETSRWQQAQIAARHSGHVRAAGCPVPVALYLWPDARSYTGQPTAEIHSAGSPPLLDAILAELFACGARPARPGEFTLRAFLAGRIDLVQAEAVLGVIDANDSSELRAALDQLAGGISHEIAQQREVLLELLADLEAGLDFVEEDIQFITRTDIIARVQQAEARLRQLLDQAANRMQSTGRPLVVLAGLPNAGKSTLFNALVKRDAALVSQTEGTTRDYLTARCRLGGVSVELVDTAGWDQGESNYLELKAQQVRREQYQRADLIVWCTGSDLDESLHKVDQQQRRELSTENAPCLSVETKCDLDPCADSGSANRVSGRTGEGISLLGDAIASRLVDPQAESRQFLGSTAARCRECLVRAIAVLRQANTAAGQGAGDELIAFEVRDAVDQLGEILGAVYTEDLLDRVFSKFCIGK
jgi:tRNA modification GTPase